MALKPTNGVLGLQAKRPAALESWLKKFLEIEDYFGKS